MEQDEEAGRLTDQLSWIVEGKKTVQLLSELQVREKDYQPPGRKLLNSDMLLITWRGVVVPWQEINPPKKTNKTKKKQT